MQFRRAGGLTDVCNLKFFVSIVLAICGVISQGNQVLSNNFTHVTLHVNWMLWRQYCWEQFRFVMLKYSAIQLRAVADKGISISKKIFRDGKYIPLKHQKACISVLVFVISLSDQCWLFIHSQWHVTAHWIRIIFHCVTHTWLCDIRRHQAHTYANVKVINIGSQCLPYTFIFIAWSFSD